MRGPGEKGLAELAVTKVRGSTVVTPMTEAPFPITDAEWDNLEVRLIMSVNLCFYC